MRYAVTVSRSGDAYLLECPSFGVQRYVSGQKLDRDRLEAEARAMVARCGSAAKSFEVDLEMDRSCLRLVE